jgi:hypothetical protein
VLLSPLPPIGRRKEREKGGEKGDERNPLKELDKSGGGWWGSCQRGRTRLMKTMRYGGVYNWAWRRRKEGKKRMCIKAHQKEESVRRERANRNLPK